MADLIQPVETPQPGTVPGIGDATEEPDPELIALEKYGAIHEQNSDFVGWISIDGTNINYPVMQTIDKPNFYLKRGFEKQYSNYGVPYVQENCALGISDNVVIYGHHMNNGSMFTPLAKYKDQSYWQNHPTVYITDDNGTHRYDIFAAYEVSTSGMTYALSFSTDAGKQKFINYCLEQSLDRKSVV